MGLTSSIFYTTVFCCERVLKWTLCAMLIALFMAAIFMTMVHSAVLGRNYGRSKMKSLSTVSDCPLFVTAFDYQYISLSKNRRNVTLDISSPQGVFISLSPKPEKGNPMIEIGIMVDGNENFIRHSFPSVYVDHVYGLGNIYRDSFRTFHVSWENDMVTIRRYGEKKPFLFYFDSQHMPKLFLGVSNQKNYFGRVAIQDCKSYNNGQFAII